MTIEEKALEILVRDEVSNIDMAEGIRRGTMAALYAENGTVLLRAKGSFLTFFASDNEDDAREALLAHPEIFGCVAHGEIARDMLQSVLGLSYETPCRQYAYLSKQKPELDPRFTYRVLEAGDADYVRSHYKPGYEDIDAAIAAGRMIGAEVEGKLAGFVGMHGEGSVGMLEVDPAYRRLGVGTALEKFMFAKHIDEGRVAYGQVFVTNDGSLALQKKMGIEMGKNLIWWMFREDAEAEFREFGSEQLGAVKQIYSRCGWTAYLNDDEKLSRAFDNSLYLLGAFSGERLVGFIRCVGDGEHVVLVQDLIILSRFRGAGLGSGLLKAAMERFKDVRMFFLVTDEGDETANDFYKKMGLQPLSRGGMISYFRY